ncbi:sensor histidine kinase [Chenggangzhangella methanolivorans]|uniref:histidine kinase n=1 Tax=Chenggangzhangella methanolivorans TaxID=1437009 RepID=A0A9E6RB36_9HYPH|nr:HAMP domain-containing sensor histidine kinase [Chenggangzhangella methanolivorans]QZO00942.1 HAMP domain-containing histidine kinase [Chenggangzhangella methanolivorans]
MTRGSLRLRLSIAAAALVALALALGGVGLFLLFEAALDRRTADELNHTARLLAGGVGFDASGGITVDRPPADPRYATPYGGLYWQIESAEKEPLRSRSLWDQTIALPRSPDADMAHHATIDLEGFDGRPLIVVFRTVRIASAPNKPLVVITVAMDRGQLAASRGMVLWLLPASLAALGLLLALAMAAFVRRALSPFRTLRGELQRVHDGRDERLRGSYPSEVQPLVDDLNRLVAQQESALGRARTQAADMAHGLKTPLAVLDALARRIEERHPALSAEIDEQSLAMQEQVSRTIARARSATAAGLQKRSTPVAPVLGQLVAAMKSLPGSDRISWRVETSGHALYPASEGELLEMLGNLVDNARKWARTSVTISVVAKSGGGAISVEDDGPGMAAAEMAAIDRGRRWDEATPGTGFGLAITRDLAASTGARLRLSAAPSRGLRAGIEWGDG